MEEVVATLLSNPPLTQSELTISDLTTPSLTASDLRAAQCARLRGATVAVVVSRDDTALASLRCSSHPFMVPVIAGFQHSSGGVFLDVRLVTEWLSCCKRRARGQRRPCVLFSR